MKDEQNQINNGNFYRKELIKVIWKINRLK